MKHPIRIFLPALGALLLCGPVMAADNVSSPNIERGRLGLEYRGGYDRDSNARRDGKQTHKLVANYGVTDRLRPEIKGLIVNNPGSDAEWEGVELGLRWQFFKKDEAWLAAALDGVYTVATQSGEADSFEAKILLGKDWGAASHVANVGLQTDVGQHGDSGLTLKFSWKSVYKIDPHFAPGIEYYANTGNLKNNPNYDEQTHRIGPTISGQITDSVKYDVGYLWGISDSASDGRVKFILSYGTAL